MKTVKDEIGETPLSVTRLYRPPKKLRKRKEYSDEFVNSRPIQPNESVNYFWVLLFFLIIPI